VSHCSAWPFGLLDFETSTLDLETCTLKFPRGARRETENVENEKRDTVRRVNNVLRRDGNSQRVDRRTEILGQSAETLGESPSLQISRLKGGSGSATLRPVRATVDSGDLWGESGRTRAKPVCGVRSLDREAKVARGRIELPTRGFSVPSGVFSVREHRPTSDITRYHISTSAAALGGRCVGSRRICLMVRGTIGGQA
jgi:hypothetical protein